MAMNIYRRCGDTFHQIAIVLLILQLIKARNARGISIRTQELRLLVFATRYLDLFTIFYSVYNSVAKVYYIVSTIGIICLIRCWGPIRSVYNPNQDTFPHWKCAVLPCAVVAFVTHLVGSGMRYFDLLELLWTFSIYLEVMAIVPQLMVLRKYGLVENLTGTFVLFLGLYRLFYIFNWIYRAHHERGYQHHRVVYTCGVLQTLVYADFFYQYFKASSRRARDSTCCRKLNSEDQQQADEDYDDDDEEEEGLLVFEFAKRNQQRQIDACDGQAKQSLLLSSSSAGEGGENHEERDDSHSSDPTDSTGGSSSCEDGMARRRLADEPEEL